MAEASVTSGETQAHCRIMLETRKSCRMEVWRVEVWRVEGLIGGGLVGGGVEGEG